MEPDRSIRLLTALEGSASTARVLNLVATHRKYGADPDLAQAPFFKNKLLDRSIILKHRLRPHEYGLFQTPRPTATKVMLPMDHTDLRAGAQTFFVGQRDFDRITEHVFGADVKVGTRDRRVLDLIDSLPSLDPFLLRENLRAHEIEPARCYFGISDADVQRMFEFVQREIMALVTLSSGEGAIASSARLVEKLLSNSPDSGFEPLKATLKLNDQEYQDGVFSWRGFLYYKWVLNDLKAPIQRVVQEIGTIRPRGPASPDASAYIPEAKRRLQRAAARTVGSAQKMLDVYNTSYAALTNEAFIGSQCLDLVEPQDAEMLAVMLQGIKPGERCGPLRVTLKRREDGRLTRFASLSMFRLPREDGHVSCVISLGAPGSAEAGPTVRRDGLLDQEAFAQTASQMLDEAERAGLPVRLDLVELPGFGAGGAKLSPPEAEARKRRLAAALRAASFGGLGAAEMAADRFALLRSTEAGAQSLEERLAQVEPGLKPVTSSLTLEADSPSQNLRAMRYALDRFIEDGPEAARAGFMTTVQRTVRETVRFKSILAQGEFFLAYQPVVRVTDGVVHHYEALARFDPNASPADTIRLAEELNLIADFDMAVFHNVIEVLAKGDPGLKIAVNLSAVSLMQPSFMQALTSLPLSAADRARMPIEITESKALPDLAAANGLLQGLRKLGHLVCLDDFGCGAASLDYLRLLDCDIVKFDGRYIQSLADSPRDAVMLKHLVALCQELKIETIAEMVETPQVAVIIKGLGVTYGQGWHYGKPMAEPPGPQKEAAPLPARPG